MENRCCGTCKWHHYDFKNADWFCGNIESENCTDWTEYKDCCPDWEEGE